MIRIKEGATLDRADRHALYALYVADTVYGWYGVKECWLTSGVDGEHKEGSKHYTGEAVDLRTHNVPREHREDILRDLSRLLGKFDVILEYPDQPREHFHVEYDPK